MPNTKRVQRAPATKKATPTADVGPDGLTLAQRLTRLMHEKSVGQTDLARMCSSYYVALVPGADPERVKQQHIFNILQGQETSWALPLIASVFDVDPMWLQYGVGKPTRLKN